MSTKTFKITSPHMTGDDIKSWRDEIKVEFARMDIDCPIEPGNDYDQSTRAFTASLCHALGMEAKEVMSRGVTPELRTRIRHRDLTALETARMAERQQWRRDLRDRYESAKVTGVHRPVVKIIEDSWGFQAGHDGLDVICQPDAVLFAMVRSKIIDVRPSGWWGLGAPADAQLRSKGDGIVQMEILESIGPFVKGRHIGYGHAEKARVKVGDVVSAGEPICHAGFANAWHIHLMYNDGSTTKGIGNINPRGIVDYSVKYG